MDLSGVNHCPWSLGLYARALTNFVASANNGLKKWVVRRKLHSRHREMPTIAPYTQ